VKIGELKIIRNGKMDLKKNHQRKKIISRKVTNRNKKDRERKEALRWLDNA